MKKALSILFAVLLIVSVAPLAVNAETVASGTHGKNITWSLAKDGTLTISGKGPMEMGSESSEFGYYGWYSYSEQITSLVIEQGVTRLCDDAFRNCSELKSVTIPDSVIGIGVDVFAHTDFYHRKSNWENNVLYAGDCLIEARTDLSGVYSIREGTRLIADRAFEGCSGLTGIDIPDGVVTIGFMAFSGCTALSSIRIPDSAAWIGSYAFTDTAYYQKESNWENGVLYIGKSLIEVKDGISGAYDIKEDTCAIADEAFRDCEHLTSVTIPSGISVIGDSSFRNCAKLASVNIPDGVTHIDTFAFGECSALTAIELPDSVREIGYYAFSSTGLTSFRIPDAVTEIDAATFWSCYELTSIDIPDGVTRIGEFAFAYCPKLTEIKIPDGITKIDEYTFHECSGLTNITIPSGVTEIDRNAFSGCTGLTEIVLPDGVTEIGACAFERCDKLTSVRIPDKVTEIGWNTFNGCTALADIVLSDGIKRIGDAAFVDTAYYNDKSNWENGVLYIGNYLLEADKSISGAYSIREGTSVIAREAFSGCIKLTGVTIPDGITQIAYDTFCNCKALTSVTIPSSVTEIDKGAFTDCEYLTIYGEKDSCAEAYAAEEEIPFRLIKNADAPDDSDTSISAESNDHMGNTEESGDIGEESGSDAQTSDSENSSDNAESLQSADGENDASEPSVTDAGGFPTWGITATIVALVAAVIAAVAVILTRKKKE